MGHRIGFPWNETCWLSDWSKEEKFSWKEIHCAEKFMKIKHTTGKLITRLVLKLEAVNKAETQVHEDSVSKIADLHL